MHFFKPTTVLLLLVATTVFAGNESDNGDGLCQVEGQTPQPCDLVIRKNGDQLPYEASQKRTLADFSPEVLKQLDEMQNLLMHRYGQLFDHTVFDNLRAAELYAVTRFFSFEHDDSALAQQMSNADLRALFLKQVAGTFYYTRYDNTHQTFSHHVVIEYDEAAFRTLPARQQALVLLHESLHELGYTHGFIYDFIATLNQLLSIRDRQVGGDHSPLSAVELQTVQDFDRLVRTPGHRNSVLVAAEPKTPATTIEPSGGGLIRNLYQTRQCLSDQLRPAYVGVGASVNFANDTSSCLGIDHYPERIEEQLLLYTSEKIRGVEQMKENGFLHYLFSLHSVGTFAQLQTGSDAGARAEFSFGNGRFASEAAGSITNPKRLSMIDITTEVSVEGGINRFIVSGIKTENWNGTTGEYRRLSEGFPFMMGGERTPLQRKLAFIIGFSGLAWRNSEQELDIAFPFSNSKLGGVWPLVYKQIFGRTVVGIKLTPAISGLYDPATQEDDGKWHPYVQEATLSVGYILQRGLTAEASVSHFVEPADRKPHFVSDTRVAAALNYDFSLSPREIIKKYRKKGPTGKQAQRSLSN